MLVRLVVFSTLFVAASSAQTAARLTGTVSDRSGAAMSGVRLTAEQVPTGLKRTTESNSQGRFLFPDLPPAEYQLRAEKTGFRPLVRQSLALTVGEAVNLDLVLEVGDIDQQITIVDRPSMVNIQTSEVSFLVSEQAMRELPLNGRNFTDLALLQPGVAAFPNRDGGSVVAHGLGMSINGQDPRSNVYLLDGTPQNDFTNGPAGSAASTVLGLEAIREFRIEMNTYSAEFGRNSGGQINALTKSGTNTTHGSLFEYFRNDHLDARNFFDSTGKPKFTRNQFGGSLGGALRKDQTFYFATYEALRERLGRTISTIVPDENARLGILPSGTVTVNPLILPYLNEYPLPNGPNRGGGLAVYSFPFRQSLRQDFGQFRLDHYFNASHQLFGRYTIDDADQRLPTDYPQFPRNFISRNQFLTLEHRYIASAHTSHTFRGNFARTRVGQNVEANTSTTLTPFIAGRTMVGNIDIGGFPRWGPQTSVYVTLVQNVFGGEWSMAHTTGRHLIKAGALGERYRDNMVNPTFSLGIQTFGGLRDFLLGVPTRFIGLPAGGALDRYWRFTLFGFYLQDDFRVSSRFTLNMGIRYEFSTMPKDIYGRDSALPNLATDTAPTVGQLYRNPTFLNVMPRAGFAWDIFGTGRTSLRGGYGLFFNSNNQQHLIVTVTNPPATPRIAVTNPTFPVPDLSRGVGNTIRPVQWDIESPRLQYYNLTLQHQLPFDTLFSIGYSGSRGQHLWRSGDWNVATPTVQPDGTLLFPTAARRRNPNFGTIELKSSDGDSWYNAMLVEVRKRFSRGLSAQASYTFSRNIDTTQASTFFSDATNGTTTAFPEFAGFNYNKGLTDYHAKHIFSMNFLYQLPGGRNIVTSGWQLGGIWSMRSGNPLTVFVSRNRSRSLWGPSLQSGMGFDRPSMAPGFTYESAILGRPEQWFNPAAFALQPAGTLGTSGRGALIGPNLRNFDLSLMRSFNLKKLSDHTTLQFRAEAFNIGNRPNFGPPALTAFDGAADNEKALSTFGLIRNTVTTARQIQLALRLTF
jgi:hypothetical protein